MRRNSFIGKVFITKSFKQTQKLGEDFAKFLEKGDVVALHGDLGSGKTTFAQGLAEELGIKNRIISPTFVMVRNYELGSISFYHIDLYRVENKEDAKNLGIEEILSSKNNIVVIEWAEKIEGDLPQNKISIEFFYRADNIRKIVFRSLNQ